MPRTEDPKVDRHIAIPKSLIEKTEPLLLEPMTRRVQHGAWSRLVTYLLLKYHRELEAGTERLPNAGEGW